MEELEKLYEVLTRDGFYTKSFEEFQTKSEDPEYQDKVYEVVSREGLFTKSKDDFINKYFVKKKTILYPLGKRKLWYQILRWWENLAHRSLPFQKLMRL